MTVRSPGREKALEYLRHKYGHLAVPSAQQLREQLHERQERERGLRELANRAAGIEPDAPGSPAPAGGPLVISSRYEKGRPRRVVRGR